MKKKITFEKLKIKEYRTPKTERTAHSPFVILYAVFEIIQLTITPLTINFFLP